MNARYQTGALGRFISQDPVFWAVGDGEKLKAKTGLTLSQYLENPQGFNSYSYAVNNPLKYVDQSGEFIGEPGRALASDQRQIASFLNQAADYTSNQGGFINRISGFVTHSVADTVSNVANVFDPDQRAGIRILGLGLTALDSATGGGKSKVANETLQTGGKLLNQIKKSDVFIGPSKSEFLKPQYSTDLLGKTQTLIGEAETTIVKYRNSLGGDGALSRIIKNYDIGGKIQNVTHQVVDEAGKIIHGHLK